MTLRLFVSQEFLWRLDAWCHGIEPSSGMRRVARKKRSDENQTFLTASLVGATTVESDILTHVALCVFPPGRTRRNQFVILDFLSRNASKSQAT